MTTTETMRLFDVLTPKGSMWLDLPLAWARPADTVRVRLAHRGLLGWHATVCDGDEQVLDLAWHDDVDQLLLDPVRVVRLPSAAPAPGEEWNDVDECWWGIVRRHGDDVFVAECDWHDLERHIGVPPRLMRPGHVCVGSTEVLWHRVGVEAWDAAWREARAFFERGEHRAG